MAEVATIQLEFRELSFATGDQRYKEAVDAAMEALQRHASGLVPQIVNVESGEFVDGVKTLGARADSYYEYLLKQWIQTAKSEKKLVRPCMHTHT